MARPTESDINTESINADYPVAGQDNDSQGFRDNFNTIKTNFTEAKSEILDLMANTARLDVDNDFLKNDINGANFKNNTEAHHPSAGTLNSSQNINITNGPHQTVVVGADVTLNLTAWVDENDKANKVRVYVKSADVDRTITFQSKNGAGTLKRKTGWPTSDNTATIEFKDDPADPDKFFVFEFFSFDQGTTVWAEYIGEYN